MNSSNTTSSSIPSHHYIHVIYVSLNVLLHGFGCPLLWKTFKECRTPQHLFIINLSLVELLINFFCVAMEVLGITVNNSTLVTPIFAGTYTTSGYLYYASMLLITGDRLVATLLVLRYKTLCTVRRAGIVLVVTWVTCIGVGAILNVYNCYHYGKTWILSDKEMIDIYIYKVPVVMAVLYLVFAMSCYFLMFCLYVKSKRSITPSHLSLLQVFRGSKFYVSLLLISSFLVLMVVPFLVLSSSWNILSPTTALVLEIMTYSSDTVDFLIYVFIYQPVSSKVKRFLICHEDTDLVNRENVPLRTCSSRVGTNQVKE